MSVLALAAAKGAPGVTTSALLLAAVWPRPACLVEADPRGGDLRFWHSGADGRPLRPDTGVVSLLAAQRAHGTERSGGASLHAHTQTLPGGLPVLVGVSTPAQHQALAPSWPRLAATLNTGPGHEPDGRGDAEPERLDVVLDGGQLIGDHASSQLLASLPLLVLVCLPTVSSVAHTREALHTLGAGGRTAGGGALGVVVIGAAADREAVGRVLVEHDRSGALVVGHLAHDPVAAMGLAGTWTRRLDRSPLVASGRRLARQLHAHLGTLQQTAEPASPVPNTRDVLVGEGR